MSYKFLKFVADDRWMAAQQERVRALVVDDEPGMVDVISMALRHPGLGVAATDSGRRVPDPVRRCVPT